MKKLRPLGHRVLVSPDVVFEGETTEGGIYIPKETKDKEQQAQMRGTVVELGPTAFKDLGCRVVKRVEGNVTIEEHDGEPQCQVGDVVYWQSYSGMRFKDKEGNFRDDLLLLNDADITAIEEEETE